jgi:hypothetical protein
MAGLTNGRWTEGAFANPAEYTALASFTSEASLLAGVKVQPCIKAHHFDANEGYGKSYRIWANGIVGSTGTPTYTFQCRLGSTAGPATLTGASIGVSAAITTASGISNKLWSLLLDMIVQTPGQGANQATMSAVGWVWSSGGFASPFWYPLEITTPDTATWTQTVDASVDNYFNLSVTCSASDASNTIKCKQLQMWANN